MFSAEAIGHSRNYQICSKKWLEMIDFVYSQADLSHLYKRSLTFSLNFNMRSFRALCDPPNGLRSLDAAVEGDSP